MAEIIEFKDVQRARVRRRERALTERCLTIMGDCLTAQVAAYHLAPLEERFVRAVKIRQLADLISYTASLP